MDFSVLNAPWKKKKYYLFIKSLMSHNLADNFYFFYFFRIIIRNLKFRFHVYFFMHVLPRINKSNLIFLSNLPHKEKYYYYLFSKFVTYGKIYYYTYLELPNKNILQLQDTKQKIVLVKKEYIQ